MKLTPAYLLAASSLWPRLASAAAAPELQVAPTSATAQGATKTRIWSTTSSSVDVVLWINSRRVTHYTTATMTAYEPAVVTGPFPATVVQTVVSHITYRDVTTSMPSGEEAASTSTYDWTSGETWVVSPAQPTDLSASVRAGDLPCGSAGEVCAEVQPDEACAALGLKTACLRQCERRDGGNWWCYRMWKREYGQEGRTMGRACWGGRLEFRQLNMPCVQGDVAVGCLRCKGVDQTWGAVNWTGPG